MIVGAAVLGSALIAAVLWLAPALAPAACLVAIVATITALTSSARLVPVAYCVLSAVYVQAALGGVFVGDIPPTSRLVRDGLLVWLAVLLALRSHGAHPLRWHVVLLATLASASLVLRAPLEPEAVSVIRYLALVPIVAMLAASTLAREIGPDRAIRHVSGALVLVSTVSAVVGLLQVLGVLTTGVYAGYVEGGRSVGIIGQPNNQAFLLVLGLVAVRSSGLFSKWRLTALSLLLSVATLATYSRAGIIALILVWLTPAVHHYRQSLRRLRRNPLIIVALVTISPVVFAARGPIISGVVENRRSEMIVGTLRDLGISGVVLGSPSVTLAVPVGRPAGSDNGWVDLVAVGGVGLAFGWASVLVRLWRLTRNSPICRALLLVFIPMSLTTSIFRLFPGVLFLWTLLLLGAVSGERSEELVPTSNDRPST